MPNVCSSRLTTARDLCRRRFAGWKRGRAESMIHRSIRKRRINGAVPGHRMTVGAAVLLILKWSIKKNPRKALFQKGSSLGPMVKLRGNNGEGARGNRDR